MLIEGKVTLIEGKVMLIEGRVVLIINIETKSKMFWKLKMEVILFDTYHENHKTSLLPLSLL